MGVQPVLSPKDMTNPDVEHLGIMAYAANLQWVTPRPPLSDSIAVHLESTSGRVGEPVSSFFFLKWFFLSIFDSKNVLSIFDFDFMRKRNDPL